MKIMVASINVMFLTMMLIAAPCGAEEQYSDDDLRVFEGKVVSVDTIKSSLTVDGICQITFHIDRDTKLQKDIYDINLSDVSKGDYVTVQYYRSGTSSREPAKVIMVTVEY
ncbi:MAG: hypothetical protein WC522_07155 [Candidatus Omnitrophota bacterium]